MTSMGWPQPLIAFGVALVLTQTATTGVPTESSQQVGGEPHELASSFQQRKDPAALVYPAEVFCSLDRYAQSMAEEATAGAGQSASLCSDLVFIVMAAEGKIDRHAERSEHSRVQMGIVSRTDFRLLPVQSTGRPLWQTYAPDATEPRLPGSKHAGVVVGAFKREQLCADCFVVTYRDFSTTPGRRSIRAEWARITAADTGKWRQAPD